MNGERIAFENWLGIKPCGAAHDLAWAAWQARASLPSPQQATPEPVTLGPLAKRNIYDAIRGAYDLGYNDARNARTVLGDSAPGYDGRSVEEDHGGALFNTLSKRLTPATPEPVGEPLFWYRPRSDGGYEGPLHDSSIEDVRKRPGAWMPLYTQPAPVVPEPLIVKGAMAGMVDAQVRDLWPTNGAALAASQQK